MNKKNELYTHIDRFIDSLIEQQAVEEPLRLETQEQTRTRLKLAAKAEFEKKIENIIRGIKQIDDHFDLVPSNQLHDLQSEWLHCLDRLESLEVKDEALECDHLSKESPLKTHLQAIGNALYEQNRFSEAKDLFFFMIFLNPADVYHLFACGHCAYQLQEYAFAAECYQGAALIEPTNVEAWIYYTQVQIDLGEKDKAKKLIEILLSVYDEIEDSSLREKVKQLDQNIKNR